MILESDAKKLLDQEENYPKVKESLMDKHRIPVHHFEYSYIETCQDGRELEKIVQILRSGEEGYFPDLTRFAENRLAVVKPKSKLLRTPCPVIHKEALDGNEKNEIAEDLTRWISNVSKNDEELVSFKNRQSSSRPFPEVRKSEEQVLEEEKKKIPRRLSSTDYSSWDKYDPDTEILKMELEEENLKKAVLAKKKKYTPKKIVQFKDFTTDVEALHEANYEKEKGNEFFRTGDYKEALKHYTNSINCKNTVAGYNNRALINIKLKNFKNAIHDCNSVLSIESDNIKALLRKAEALGELSKYTEALESVQRAIEVDPNNTLAQEQAQKFQKLCGIIPQKAKRFLVQDVAEEKANQKKILWSQNAAITSNKEVIIPIPGTSNMSPPHYITCTNGDEKKIKEQTMRVHTPGQIIRLVSVDNSEVDDDDCCTVNHLKKICSNENLTKVSGSPETKSLLIARCKDERRENVFQINKSGHISKKIKHRKGKKGKLVITQPQEDQTENLNQLTDQVSDDKPAYLKLIAEVNSLTLSPNWERNKETTDEEKTPKQQSIKKDTNAGGEPYIKDESFDILPQDIQSPYNFLKAWNSANVDKTLEQHAAILRSIDMNRIVAVIGCKLDNTMFTTIIKCLCTHFAVPGEVERLYIILSNMVHLPRFVIISMLMSTEDQNCVNTLMNFLNQHGKPLCEDTYNKFFNN